MLWYFFNGGAIYYYFFLHFYLPQPEKFCTRQMLEYFWDRIKRTVGKFVSPRNANFKSFLSSMLYTLVCLSEKQVQVRHLFKLSKIFYWVIFIKHGFYPLIYIQTHLLYLPEDFNKCGIISNRIPSKSPSNQDIFYLRLPIENEEKFGKSLTEF